jgi:hypothetical protein
VVLLGDAVIPEVAVSEPQTGSRSPARDRLQVLSPAAGSWMDSISLARGFLKCLGKVVGLGLVKGAEEAGAVSGELGSTEGAGEQVGTSLLSVLHVRSAQMVPIAGFSEHLKPGSEAGSSVLVSDLVLEPIMI